jgi:hypothetical protein
MTRKAGFGALGFVVAALAPLAADAAIFADTFAYPDGELGTASGGVWALHSGTGGQTVTNEALVIDDAGTGDYNRSLGGAPAVSSGVLYAGFDMTVSETDLPTSASGANPYFAHFGELTSGATSNFVSRVFLYSGTGANTFNIGISRGSGTGATTTNYPTELTAGTTYRVVHAYDLDNNVATLWVDPVDASSTNVTNNSGTLDPAALNFFMFRIAGSSDGDKTVDNLVVSTSFAEVVPEPGSLAVLALGGLAVLARRQRRRLGA